MELTLKKLYVFGIWCMAIIAGANVWGFVLKIQANAPAWVLLGALGGILLNLMFAVLFWYLAYKMPEQQQIPEEMRDLGNLKELFDGDGEI